MREAKWPAPQAGAGKGADERGKFAFGARVKAGRRFVHDNDFRRHGKHGCDGGAAHLAAGKMIRGALVESFKADKR